MEKRIRAIAEEIKSAGGAAYFVGGYVRDRLRGVDSLDYDVEVHTRHIVCETREKALEVLAALEKGARFEALVPAYSTEEILNRYGPGGSKKSRPALPKDRNTPSYPTRPLGNSPER